MDPIQPQFDSSPLQPYSPKRTGRFLFFCVAGILVISGLVYYFFLGSNSILISNKNATQGKTEETTEEETNPMPASDPNRFNVLILGIRGEDDLQDGGLLTDTIEVISFDKSSKKVAIVNLPRDLYINMLGVKGKLNEAYQHGIANNQGIPVASEVISRISGIHIDKTVVFDFTAFETVINNLGGIDVTLDKPFSEGAQWGYAFSLPAGINHLNGEQALYYARSRFSSSDFDRSRRQQQIIFAIKAKILSLGILGTPAKITSLLADLNSHIRTNFQLWDIKDVINLASSLSNTAKITTHIISTDNLLYQTHTTGGEYILLTKSGNYSEIQNFFKHIFEDPKPTTQMNSLKK